MLKFSSKIFEEITVDGLINLKAERAFKWFRAFDLKISQEDQHLLTISASTNFLKFKFSIPHNQTEFQITIENDSTIIFDNERFEIKVDKLYPFKKKYGEIWKDDKRIGEVQFEKKFLDIVLNFIPDAGNEISKKTALKVGLLVLLNIADLDGSE